MPDRMTDGGDGRGATMETVRRAGPEARPRDSRSVGRLVRDLGEESSRLIREEMELARTEMREKLDVYEKNGVRMLFGGVILLAALGILLVALNRGLTMLLEQVVSIEVAVWLAPLILGVVFGLTGWALVKAAQRGIREEGVAPKQTLRTLREERDWAKREAREMRNA